MPQSKPTASLCGPHEKFWRNEPNNSHAETNLDGSTPMDGNAHAGTPSRSDQPSGAFAGSSIVVLALAHSCFVRHPDTRTQVSERLNPEVQVLQTLKSGNESQTSATTRHA